MADDTGRSSKGTYKGTTSTSSKLVNAPYGHTSYKETANTGRGPSQRSSSSRTRSYGTRTATVRQDNTNTYNTRRAELRSAYQAALNNSKASVSASPLKASKSGGMPTKKAGR